MKIKTGDTVVVIAGKDSKTVTKKGVEATTGKVLKVYPESNRVVVEGVNRVKKHQKPNQMNQEGKIIEMEAPIDASNVMLLDPKTKTPTRIGYKMVDGKKVRYAKKSGTVLDK